MGCITVVDHASMDVEFTPSRLKTVRCSSRRGRGAARGGREQGPGHVGGVERVEIVADSVTCPQWRLGWADAECFGLGRPSPDAGSLPFVTHDNEASLCVGWDVWLPCRWRSHHRHAAKSIGLSGRINSQPLRFSRVSPDFRLSMSLSHSWSRETRAW